jgi:hypothetical protein
MIYFALCPNYEVINVYQDVSKEGFVMSSRGYSKTFLGLNIVHGSDGSISINQTGYIDLFKKKGRTARSDVRERRYIALRRENYATLYREYNDMLHRSMLLQHDQIIFKSIWE